MYSGLYILDQEEEEKQFRATK